MVAGSHRPTIHDVARQAGVSATTVSHTYSGNRMVAPETRRLVREAAAALGYRPDALAQGLRQNRLGVIALIARHLEDRIHLVADVDYFLRLAGAAAVAAMKERYGVMLVADPSRPQAPGTALACDGVIVTEPEHNDELVTMLTAAGIPVVTIGDVPGEPHDPRLVIGIDAPRLTMLVLDHLAAAGARRIALVNGADRNEWCLTSAASYRQWTAARGESGHVIEVAQDQGEAGGRSAVDEFHAAARRAGTSPPDGYYCVTAAQALGVCARLHELGLRVPADVRVVAGSDSEPCRTAAPPITAVDLEPEVLARRAVATMLAVLHAQEPPQHPTRVGRLVVRGSS
jgi:DNA-binding LacI/PurR family transcriptional regulator